MTKLNVKKLNKKSSKIKVLQSVSSLGIGGNELFVMNLFRNIDKSKFQIDFLIYDDRLDFEQEVKAAGSKIYLCPPVQGNKIISIWKEACFVFKILKSSDYDVIHCNGCSFVNILKAAIPAKLVGNIKIISHGHSVGKINKNSIDNIIRAILRLCLSSIVDIGCACSDLVGQSKYTKRFLNSQKYKIVHNAIEIEKYSYNINNRNILRDRYCLENKIVIGNIGRLAKEKNQEFLLDILKEILKENKNVVLLIVGGGELEQTLKEKAKKLRVEDSVVFTGSVMDAEKYYSAMDVYVMTSLYEGLPFTVIEAQVNGLKCVLADSITKMADVSGDTTFLSLNAGTSVWASKILKNSSARSKKEKTDYVKNKYNIKNETLRIQKFYTLK